MKPFKKMMHTRVVRDLQIRQAADTTTSRAVNDLPTATSIRKEVNKQVTSGLTPIEVGLTLAVLFGVFLILLFVGGLCKVFNKPRKEARPYVTGQQKLFQPSAAGYGSRIAGSRQPEVKGHGVRASLLAGASPMGRDGRFNEDMRETSIDSPISNGSGQDYFGRTGGHARGQSTGISLPGATAASSRRGGPTHPPIQGSSIGPDGSGFKPGQVFNYSGMGPGPSGYASRPTNLSPTKAGVSQRGPSPNVGLGPPPASDARRRSRYARAESRRIDSVGPGVIRKSMYLGPGDEYGPEATAPRASSSTNMRRVDSIGRGDHRRKSTYNSDQARQSRSASMYSAMNAQVDNFGAGKGGDPLGAENNSLSPSMAPRQYRGQNGQQPAMPAMQRQISPPSFSASGLPSPSSMGNAPVVGKPIASGYPISPSGYPGGGRPRMHGNQGYTPMVGGYERAPRQIV